MRTYRNLQEKARNTAMARHLFQLEQEQARLLGLTPLRRAPALEKLKANEAKANKNLQNFIKQHGIINFPVYIPQ